MGRLRVDTIKNSTGTSGPIFTGPAEFSSTAHIVLPKGTTAERPSSPSTGALRYNTDTSTVEYYNGTSWVEVSSYDSGIRGVFGAGYAAPTRFNTIDYITIASTGNATDFGDLTTVRNDLAACSSSTRGVFGGGYAPTNSNIIDYITIATTGDATDFGDLSVARRYLSSCSSSTRGVFGGGEPTGGNVLDYITIATTGNATDFGDLTVARALSASCSSSTRGVFGGGRTPAFTYSNTIDYITIATTGNATDFGDLTVGRAFLASCSSSTRGVFGGGFTPTPATTYLNTIDYITIASTGDATDFGDLTTTRRALAACSSSGLGRGVFGGGFSPTPAPAIYFNTIDYINISTTGDATDFGDLTVGRENLAACSNGHGGLS